MCHWNGLTKGLVPDYIIGDMDSIEEEAFNYYNSEGCVFEKFPTRKSETDAELGVILAEKMEFIVIASLSLCVCVCVCVCVSMSLSLSLSLSVSLSLHPFFQRFPWISHSGPYQ